MKGGKPYVMFGDGRLAACKPISEADLAAFIADCVQGEDRVNQILPIGGKSRSRVRLLAQGNSVADCSWALIASNRSGLLCMGSDPISF